MSAPAPPDPAPGAARAAVAPARSSLLSAVPGPVAADDLLFLAVLSDPAYAGVAGHGPMVGAWDARADEGRG